MKFYLPISTALGLTAIAPFLQAQAITSQRPNIIFLLSDDQVAGALGCYGNREIHTPNLDKIARQGIRFTNHYNTTSISMASRCCVMTGLYEYRHGCNFLHGDLQRNFIEKSYPVLIRQAGYFIGFAGKIGFVLQDEEFEAFESLFDQWAGGPGQTVYETKGNKGIAKYADKYPHCSRAYGAWGQDFLKAAKESGKPFCMSISFKAPHMPFSPDPIDMKLYEKDTFTRPANYGVENGRHLSKQVHTSRAATNYREWMTAFDSVTAKYYALITGMDAAVGMILEFLESEDLANNTIIIFTSDNGYNRGSHGFGDKVIPYEEGSKSPLIIYDPRLSKKYSGKVCNAITANVDMAATILALSGVPAPGDIDGKNLLPLLTNPKGKVRDYLPLFNFWGVESAQSMAIVTPQWKYIYWYYGGNGMKPTEELFNLTNDRIEMHQLAGDMKQTSRLKAMRKLYDIQLDLIANRVFQDHGYQKYPVIFNRMIPWEQKTSLLEPADQIKKPKSNAVDN